MREKFDAELKVLHAELTKMGTLCKKAILLSSQALLKGDTTAYATVTSLADELERLERSVEGLCIKLLLQQQPVAGDLRQISAALKMITDMKRIGVQAGNIAEIEKGMTFSQPKDLELIDRMAQVTVQMVNGSVRAYIQQDVDLAKQIIKTDDVVDEYFVSVKKLLLQMITQNPEQGEEALDLLMIAKYYEKIGDHAVNIAEWVIFSAIGEYKGEFL